MEHATKAAETEECEKEVNGIYEGLELLKLVIEAWNIITFVIL